MRGISRVAIDANIYHQPKSGARPREHLCLGLLKAQRVRIFSKAGFSACTFTSWAWIENDAADKEQCR